MRIPLPTLMHILRQRMEIATEMDRQVDTHYTARYLDIQIGRQIFRYIDRY